MSEIVDRLRTALADRYEVGEEIGSGGMAVVHRARDLRIPRDVAVKILRPEVASVLGSERFVREIAIEGRLQHPHIVPIFEAGQADGIVFCVMPFIAGESLGDRLEREGPLPMDDAVSITSEVAGALAYAHEQGFVHRDIKPGNILLTSGHAVVADFGIARAIEQAGGERLTESGQSPGTPAYMSPEQAEGSDKIDGRTDLYSLGCVLFEMVTGGPPFPGDSARAVLANHLTQPPPSVEKHRPGTPPSVTHTIEWALRKVPADRVPTADAFIRSLRTRPRPGVAVSTLLKIAAALALLGGVSWAVAKMTAPGPPATLDENRVVVFPLVERGFETDGLGSRLAVWIEQGLEGAEPLRFIDGWEQLGQAERNDPTRLPQEMAAEIARRTGAAYYVTGVAQNFQDSAAAVTLRLYDVAGDSLVIQRTASASVADASVFDLGLSALLELLPSLLDPGRELDVTALLGRDLAAIALFIEGEQSYRRSQFSIALEQFERSLERDSALALAAIQGAAAANWLVDLPRAQRLAEAAVARDSLLSQRDAYRARGLLAYLMGDADSAVTWFDRAIAEAPDLPDGHMLRAEVFYHLFPSAVSLDSLAGVSFHTAARLDPEFYPPLVHLLEMAVRRGDVAHADTLLGSLMWTDAPVPLVQQLKLMVDCATRGPDGFDWGIPDRHRHLPVMLAAKSFSAGGANLPCAIGGYQAALSVEAEPNDFEGLRDRWGSLIGLQGIMVARGQMERAHQLLDSAVATGAGHAKRLYMVDALVDSRFDDRVEQLDAELAARGDGYAESSAETRWLLGAWRSRRGEVAKAREHLAALEAVAATRPDPRTGLFRDALAAHVILLEAETAADTASAIDALSALRPTSSMEHLTWSFGDPLAFENLLLAELLLATGRPAEALSRAEVFDHHQPAMFVLFLPRSLELRIVAAEALGRQDLVLRYQRRLAEILEPGTLVIDDGPQSGGER